MKRLVLTGLLVSFVSCGSPPPPREYPRLPDSSGGDDVGVRALEREELNDEPALVARRSESPIVTLRVAFDAGSAEDDRGREGLTMLTARLMVEGGAGELSYAELSRALYPMAGTIDTHVGRDQTVFVGRVHRDHFEAFYELFRDVLLRPRMGQEDFSRIQEQVRTSLTVDLRNARDEQLGKEVLQGFLYEGHPFAHPALGTEAGLARIRVDDTRAHRSRMFCAGRATIGLAGAFPEGFETRVARDIGQLSSDACVGRAILPEPPETEGPEILIVDKASAQAIAVSMGFTYDVRRDHEDYPALVLATAWLGQHRQFVGRLMQAIRGERGLNYGDYAYAEHFTQEGWSRFPIPNDARRQQYFSIWLRPLRPETAHFAIRLAVRELRRLAAEGLTEEQFEHIRMFCDRYYALFQQTSSRRLGYAMDDAFYGVDAAYLPRLREAWAALTREQLNAALAQHLTPDRLRIAIVAPEAERLATRIAEETEESITYRSSVPEHVTEEDRELIGYELGIPRDRIRIVPVSETFSE